MGKYKHVMSTDTGASILAFYHNSRSILHNWKLNGWLCSSYLYQFSTILNCSYDHRFCFFLFIIFRLFRNFSIFDVFKSIVTAASLTIVKSKNSIQELWNFAYVNERTKFFELRTNLKIRFTLLNQLLSLPLSWCSLHSLNLSNFIRYRSVDGKIKSKIMLLSNMPIMITIYTILLMSGGFICYLFFYGYLIIFKGFLNKLYR
jgi:hypothetical protein